MGVQVEGIEDAIDLIQDASDDAIAGFVLEITNRVRDRTPRDTGMAANSWLVTFDRQDEGDLGNNDEASPSVDEIAANLPNPIYINNGVNYIGVLEAGHSNQSPQGMVDITLAEAPQILRDELEDELRSRGG